MKLIIMRGLPGSGKSTTAKMLDGYIASTDDYFMLGKAYLFDPSLLFNAHVWNQDRVEKGMRLCRSPIIVDNTNIRLNDMKPYIKLAEIYNYEIEVKESDAPWKNIPEICFNHCTHKVPLEKIVKMYNQWERYPIEDNSD